jgi:hypothetical protein
VEEPVIDKEPTFVVFPVTVKFPPTLAVPRVVVEIVVVPRVVVLAVKLLTVNVFETLKFPAVPVVTVKFVILALVEVTPTEVNPVRDKSVPVALVKDSSCNEDEEETTRLARVVVAETLKYVEVTLVEVTFVKFNPVRDSSVPVALVKDSSCSEADAVVIRLVRVVVPETYAKVDVKFVDVMFVN